MPWSEETPWTWPTSETTAPIEAAYQYTSPPGGIYNGETFLEGVSGQIDDIANLDYWTLRQRSAALFYGNSYGRGIIRRFVNDIVNTGLEVEVIPDEEILGLEEYALEDWSDLLERRYKIYQSSPEIVDAKGRREEGELLAQIDLEALVCGDCLVVNRQDTATKLPQIEIVNGDRVQTPPNMAMDSSIVDGVHLNSRGVHLGFWVNKGTVDVFDDDFEYIPARGKSTGRKAAWMVYGLDKREDGVRGEPLLSVAIQPLKSILDYRGSAQLKAEVNSHLVGYMERTLDKPATLPMQGGAVKTGTVTGDGTNLPVGLKKILPGMFIEQLQPGEKPTVHSTQGTDVNFGPFEAAVMVGVAWSLGVPPEELLMSYNKSWSASQASKTKWRSLIFKERRRLARQHCKNLYEEWFISELLLSKFAAPGFLEARVDPSQYDIKRAWLRTQWHGPIEPSIDSVKQTAGYTAQMNECLITATRAAREMNGTKFSDNCKRRKKEIEMKMAAVRPLLDAQKEFGSDQVTEALASLGLTTASTLNVKQEEDPDVADAAN